ncbi:MAG: RDD family protein [Dysgonamonadaceae bacterium]|jgi:uncharacterized RDD family membrane protein YckC|nr:RDD family protein [Dysgonamonadaceae bacterium]
MESIDITTGQNVIIKYQAASLIERFCALLLDYIFVVIYLFTVIFALVEILDAILNSSEAGTVTLIVIFCLPGIAYHFVFESFMGGKTPGKIIMKIRVTHIDGSTPGIGSYFLRWLLMPIDLFPSGGIGGLFIVFSKHHQRLGDMAAGTIIVKTNPPVLLDLDKSYYEFSDEYEPTFIHVDRLSEGQILFITKLLLDPQNKAAVENSTAELAGKVKQILNVESKADSRRFLETIVRDYNYYAGLGI